MSCEISKTVFTILQNNIEDGPEINIESDTELDTLGIDSIALVEAIFELEEEFDITIPNPGENDSLDTNFQSAGDVVDAVKQLISESAEAA